MGNTPTISPREMQQALAEGAVVLTPNQRLSRRLAHDYAAARSAQGETCWPTPTILPWSAWLHRLWNESLSAGRAGGSPPTLVNTAQTMVLWEQVIRRSKLDKGIMNLSATAAGVAQAWTLLHAWQLPIPDTRDYPDEDAAAFRVFALDFRRECARARLVDYACLPEQLLRLCTEQTLALPRYLLLYGFDELTPQQTRLLNAIENRDCRIDVAEPPVVSARPQRVDCYDAKDELAHAAGWAQARLVTNPQAQIGIVVPDLHTRRAQVERVFSDALHPRQVLPGVPREQRSFNISLGMGLDQCALIRTALNVLRLAQGRIDARQLGSLLRSPYLGAADSEAAGRAQLDLRLRERGDTEIWLADILGIARRPPASDATDRVLAPEFLAQLERLFVHHRAATGEYLHHQWAQKFSGCLRAMGWPGERALNSQEYQQQQAWQELLDNYASLDVVSDAVPVGMALSRLNQLAGNQLFQPKTPWRPVQILGLLEATGQHFDHLWVCGMDDESWPPAARPDPWLPLRQQREHRLPHADAEREYEYADSVTRKLGAMAPEVVFSHARWESDRERGPSPLTAPFALSANDCPAPAQVHFYRDLIHASQTTESIRDHAASAVVAGALRGGSGLLAAQAACPFQAFARYRLGARGLEEVSIGLDPRARGLLLHQSMQQLWAGISGSRNLRRLSDDELTTAISDALDYVLAQAAQHRPRTFTPRFVAVEKTALATLISAWMGFEKERNEFTVAAREQDYSLELDGLELRVVLDRIDRSADGADIILDYKTGKVSASGWEGERPDAPQLPMYALALQAPPAVVAFAQIRPGQSRFVGCGRDDTPLPGVVAEDADQWQARVQAWHATLTALAGQFRNGAAAVDPKNGAQTCRYCDLASLCRIHEVGKQSVADQESTA